MCEISGPGKLPDTLDSILPLLADQDRWVRIAAVDAVSAFIDERVVPALRTCLADSEIMVRKWAAVELARKKDASGVGVVLAALADNPGDEAAFVVPALERLMGHSFGRASWPGIHSNMDAMEEAYKSNEKLAAEWLAWWDAEGRARYAGD
jgi:HEAT repeats